MITLTQERRSNDEIRKRIAEIDAKIPNVPRWMKESLRVEVYALEWALKLSSQNAQQRMNPEGAKKIIKHDPPDRGKGRPVKPKL